MNQQFGFFGEYEFPSVTLCNPDKTELYSLGLAFETKITKKFNGLSEFSFKFPKSIDGGTTILDTYDYLNNKRIVRIEGEGFYQIINVEESADGSTPIKIVSCESLEAELIQKKVNVYGPTTKKLYDLFTPSGTILDDMIGFAPNWTVGTIDASLLVKYRTFNISDSNIYNFLMNDVAKAFECVFFFDTDTRTISAKAITTSTTTSDIFLSFDNVIKSATFSEKSDEIVTCLAVYGGGSLNIRAVNPIGTDKIYDFSYYKNTNWMTQDLVDAVTIWENLIVANQPEYANQLTLLRGYNLELITLQSDLTALQTNQTVLEGTQKARIQAGVPYSDVNAQLASNQSDIMAKQLEITNKQIQVSDTTQILVDINNLVSFDSNFTAPQLLELDNFIYQNTYKNENIIQTDLMNDVEIQDAEQDLYDQALAVLDKVSQPRYEIELSSVNYVALQEFSTFTNQTELGTEVICEITPEVFIQTVLLQIEMTYDNPEDFSILLSNRVRKDGAGFVYSDLMGQVVKTGGSAINDLKWSNWESTYKDDVSTFITSSLNTANNNIINNSNQEILINANGLRGRTFDPNTNTYSPTQVWLTSSVLAFSDDGFATSKLALGSVSTNAGTKFGLVAEILVGKILAGNSLKITNSTTDSTSNFILDENGAVLNNAKFTITNANSRILLNPNDVQGRIFRIQKNEATVFNDKFWVDNAGNVNFSGNLSAATGSFSGDISGSNGTFSGTVSATQLLGTVQWSQIVNAPIPSTKFNGGSGYSASGITTGSMAGDRIVGGVIYSPTGGASIDMRSSNSILLSANSSVTLNGGGAFVDASSGNLNLTGGSVNITSSNLNWGGSTLATQSYVSSRISGKSGSYTVNEIGGDSTWQFSNGLVQNVFFNSVSRGVSTSVNPYSTNTGTWTFSNGRRVS